MMKQRLQSTIFIDAIKRCANNGIPVKIIADFQHLAFQQVYNHKIAYYLQ